MYCLPLYVFVLHFLSFCLLLYELHKGKVFGRGPQHKVFTILSFWKSSLAYVQPDITLNNRNFLHIYSQIIGQKGGIKRKKMRESCAFLNTDPSKVCALLQWLTNISRKDSVLRKMILPFLKIQVKLNYDLAYSLTGICIKKERAVSYL